MTGDIPKTLPAKIPFWKRRIVQISTGVMIALLLAVLGCCLFPRQVLTVDSGPVKADVMVVLGGENDARSQRAAKLFQQGEAPKILVSGAGDYGKIEQWLETNGVPAGVITLERLSHTTLENAKYSVPILRQLGAQRVIIVTSWYHSRRALMCFEHFAPDITFYSRPSYAYYGAQEGWARKYVNSLTQSEFIKLAGYWGCYGVCPF